MIDGGGLAVRVLGPLEVTSGGERLELGGAAPRSVLAALLLDVGRVVPVGTLVERVWDGDDGPASLTTLHSYISRLRRLLEPGARSRGEGWRVLVTRPPGYQLLLPQGALDAELFVRLVRDARLEPDAGRAREAVRAALSLWRGQAYSDIPARFATDEAIRLHEQRVQALEFAAELDLALGRQAELLEELPALVRREPLREGLRRSLMLALYRSGRQAEALAVYADVQALLRRELGVDPGPELRLLHTEVLRQDPALDLERPGTATAAPAGSAAVAPPGPLGTAGTSPTPAPAPLDTAGAGAGGPDGGQLLGRDTELRRLLDGLAPSRTGVACVVAVVGEAGIGKTRLLEEAAERAATDGALVAWGRCWEHEGASPLWPWVQVLRSLAASVGAQAVTQALTGRGEAAGAAFPELGGPATAAGTAMAAGAGVGTSPSTVAEAAVLQVFDGVAALLEAWSAQRPLLLIIEDLHWADPQTARLVAFLSAHLRAAQVGLLISVRAPSDAPSNAGSALLAALARQPHTTRIELHGIPTDAVRQHLEATAGQSVDDAIARDVAVRTAGNPFFVTELGRLLAVGGDLGAVPEGVRDVTAERLDRLGPDVRALLSAAAVAGRTFDPELLEQVSGLPTDAAEDAVDLAFAAGLLAAEPGPAGDLRFAHALVQDTVLGQLTSTRRARLHARAGLVLERRHDPDPSAVAADLAHHFAAAGRSGDHPAKAVQYTLLAAQVARDRWAYAEAEQLLRLALDRIAALPGPDRDRFELQARVRLGSLLTLLLGYADSRVATERRRALELARRGGDVDELFAAMWGTWGAALIGGDTAEADRLADELFDAATTTGHPVLLLGARHAQGQVRWHQGRFEEATVLLEQAVELADAHRGAVRVELFLQHPVATARGWLAIVLTKRNCLVEADALAAAARERAQEVGDPYTSAYVGMLECWRQLWLDQPDQALTAGDAALTAAREHGFAQLEALLLAPHGWARLHAGDQDAGRAQIEVAVQVFADTRSMLGHLMLGVLGDVQRRLGRPDQAVPTLDAGLALAADRGERFHVAELHRLRALALLDLGAPDVDVLKSVRAAQQVAREQGALLYLERISATLPPRLVRGSV